MSNNTDLETLNSSSTSSLPNLGDQDLNMYDEISLSSSQDSSASDSSDKINKVKTHESSQLIKMVTTKNDDYTILTKNERITIALLLSLIGLCSSMSMPIYWTALSQLQNEFNTTEARINYTVTAYLCFQAVAPVFISSLSDILGRRPTILICILGGIATNIGLAVSRTYWLIVFLRCVLATCLAPLISITTASVGDFTTKRNRGGLTSLTQGFTLIGQGIAPFLGAVMDTAWGWPAIFWFSAAFEGLVLMIAFFFLPETHRGLVGDLSVRPKLWIHKSPILYYFKNRLIDYNNELVEGINHKYDPWTPLKKIFKINVFYILLPSSILFALWTIAQTSLSIHLSKDYNMSVLNIGFCFFSPGSAAFVGTLLTGRVLDHIYSKQKQKYNEKYFSEKNNHYHSLSEIPPFNIIYVRLYSIPFAALITCLATIVFGWCIEYKVSLVPILIMSFILTFGTMFPLNITATVLVDMYPEISGGATALNNLFRCGMSAIFVSCLNKMESSMTVGGTYTFMAGISMLATMLIVILMRKSEKILIKARDKKLEKDSKK
jgi:MFS family permease